MGMMKEVDIIMKECNITQEEAEQRVKDKVKIKVLEPEDVMSKEELYG